MMDQEPFRYQPSCAVHDCQEPARYKIAAPWSNGQVRELKNYGLACEGHRNDLLNRARTQRSTLVLSEGETVGQIEVYHLEAGKRDADLAQV